MARFTLFIFAILGVGSAQAKTYNVGQKDYIFNDTSRNRTLVTHVWYPATSDTKTAPIAAGFFAPVTSAREAFLAPTPQKFPVVLLSHGSGGKSDKLFWLAEYLTRNGVIVLAVDHTGNMTGDNSADGMMRVWERATDLTFALNRFLQISEFHSRLDLEKVAAAGHSAGGTTALLLGGARFSLAQFTSPIPDCVGTKDPYYGALCNQLNTIDVKSYGKETVEADYGDARVKAVVALDPGFAKSFQVESLTTLKAKPLIILADKLNAPQDQIHAKDFQKLLPASTEVIPNSFHMTFISACKPNYPKSDPELKELCKNNDQKVKIQKQVAEKTLAFFQKVWG